MIGLLQRVSMARVVVEDVEISAIGQGLLVLVGVVADDSLQRADRLLERLLTYRVFTDAAGKMNLDLRATGGGLLLIPQFTLAADTKSGTRAGFSTAAPPAMARELFEYLVVQAHARYGNVACGSFGADMSVSLVNEGPVTFWLES
ncbi:MAG: D-aminoacyl-tRNA deacylase [Burkholderiales bacterium]